MIKATHTRWQLPCFEIWGSDFLKFHASNALTFRNVIRNMEQKTCNMLFYSMLCAKTFQLFLWDHYYLALCLYLQDNCRKSEENIVNKLLFKMKYLPGISFPFISMEGRLLFFESACAPSLDLTTATSRSHRRTLFTYSNLLSNSHQKNLDFFFSIMEGYLSDSCYPEENWTVTEIVVAAAPAILGFVSRELGIEPSALASFVPEWWKQKALIHH